MLFSILLAITWIREFLFFYYLRILKQYKLLQDHINDYYRIKLLIVMAIYKELQEFQV